MVQIEIVIESSYAGASLLRTWISFLVRRLEGDRAYLFGCVPVEARDPLPSEIIECSVSGGRSWTEVDKLPNLFSSVSFHFEWLGLILLDENALNQVPDDLRFVDGLSNFDASDGPLVPGAMIEILIHDASLLIARSTNPTLIESLRTLSGDTKKA